MTGQNEGRTSAGFNFYGPQYARFGSNQNAGDVSEHSVTADETSR